MMPPILPTINASLNALAGIFLLLGWRAILRKQPEAHRKFMLTALGCSALFLICYITYHVLAHGVVTRYSREGLSRAVYFFILGTHTPLAMVVLPFCLIAVWHALHSNLPAHTRITRWLLPVWLYVSVTGVLIYLMLYIWK